MLEVARREVLEEQAAEDEQRKIELNRSKHAATDSHMAVAAERGRIDACRASGAGFALRVLDQCERLLLFELLVDGPVDGDCTALVAGLRECGDAESPRMHARGRALSNLCTRYAEALDRVLPAISCAG